MSEIRDFIEIVKSSQRVVIGDLERLKASDGEHAEFYAELQKRQEEIIRDLEAMLENEG